jgi:hypothetical protein
MNNNDNYHNHDNNDDDYDYAYAYAYDDNNNPYLIKTGLKSTLKPSPLDEIKRYQYRYESSGNSCRIHKKACYACNIQCLSAVIQSLWAMNL